MMTVFWFMNPQEETQELWKASSWRETNTKMRKLGISLNILTLELEKKLKSMDISIKSLKPMSFLKNGKENTK